MSTNTQIFVVEDDLEDRMILNEYFNDRGLCSNVRYFDNGEVFLNELEKISDADSLPRLIVLDLNMPLLNGTQTLLYLKKESRFKHIPVIIFSTSENDEEKRKCISYGADDYLVKPMSYDEGRNIVELFASYL